MKKHVTDGLFCEQKVMEFEEAADPPRFPLLVSPAFGSDGAGCNILSFSAEEDGKAFQEAPVRDLNLVTCFIEVKGRSNSSAAI
ncbi:MAG: hypothetical protein WCN98_02275 [Verrucomicrobiaceae bacterium]